MGGDFPSQHFRQKSSLAISMALKKISRLLHLAWSALVFRPAVFPVPAAAPWS
jgi:hypothetical protein